MGVVTYKERCEALRNAKDGDRWVNIKTGRWADIVWLNGFYVKVAHELGSVRVKQSHYFAGDFMPDPRYTITAKGKSLLEGK